MTKYYFVPTVELEVSTYRGHAITKVLPAPKGCLIPTCLTKRRVESCWDGSNYRRYSYAGADIITIDPSHCATINANDLGSVCVARLPDDQLLLIVSSNYAGVHDHTCYVSREVLCSHYARYGVDVDIDAILAQI